MGMETSGTITNVEHRESCTGKGFRYGATVRRTAKTEANGTAGKVLMICKDSSCPARRYV